MEKTKQQIIDEMEEINDEIEIIIHTFYSNLSENERYKQLTDRLRELLKELDKKERK